MNLNLDQVDHVTLDLMVNQPQYERYLRAHEAALSGKYEKAKRFYKKRIIELTRDLLKGETVNDIFVLQAFEAYAKACITYFRTKDKNDTLQEEHAAECVAVGYLPPIVETVEESLSDNNDGDNDGDNDAPPILSDSTKKKLEILMSFDKHKAHTPTLDTYVIKTSSAPSAAAPIIPKQKEINLDDPKFKTKDIKPKKPIKPNSDE
ncbi:MAG: hypothetical protein EBU84_01065 [Actinobacteria bacterium]|jgi:hypothetical protein|nr:hypothetical protein [Actinomycetota bacterium]